MPDRDHAAMMLAMAGKDFQALNAMLDEQSFAEEIFGFHAQQAVEKTLKAWLSTAVHKFPNVLFPLPTLAGEMARVRGVFLTLP